jgi:hypothetical protein
MAGKGVAVKKYVVRLSAEECSGSSGGTGMARTASSATASTLASRDPNGARRFERIGEMAGDRPEDRRGAGNGSLMREVEEDSLESPLQIFGEHVTA